MTSSYETMTRQPLVLNDIKLRKVSAAGDRRLAATEDHEKGCTRLHQEHPGALAGR
jgi:hypothetical protein